ncbi:MAG: ribonuclease HII [Oscillospiraceae bacterium]|nr:ribonuclease HII [Oscillospiraceae bacterium]
MTAKILTEFDNLEYEKKYWENGFVYVAGADEAGRGPLAGPVYAAAVIFPQNIQIEGLTDSKKLSEKKRDYYFDVIKEKAVAFSIASVDEKVIDEINILNAAHLAFKKAIDALNPAPEIALIDGNSMKNLSCPFELIVKGDQKSLTIAAASVLAKVSRDRFMDKIDKEYPQYQFSKHKGYGTKLHYEMLAKYGACPYHRQSFRLFKN